MGLAACGRVAFDPLTDATTIDAATICAQDAPFDPPQLVGELDTAFDSATLRLTSNELTGVYWSFETGGVDLYLATRNDAQMPFTSNALTNLNTADIEFDPSIAPDGSYVLFVSNRPGGMGGLDVYEAMASDAGAFGAPQLVGDLSSPQDENQPTIMVNGSDVYLSSTRAGLQQIFHSRRLGPASYTTPTLVTELGSGSEADPLLTSDNLTMYWASSRTGGSDIYRATRPTPSDPFASPTLVTELASTAYDGPAWLSADNCRMYMSSARLGQANIYLATRSP